MGLDRSTECCPVSTLLSFAVRKFANNIFIVLYDDLPPLWTSGPCGRPAWSAAWPSRPPLPTRRTTRRSRCSRSPTSTCEHPTPHALTHTSTTHLRGSALLPPDTHSCWTGGFSLQYQQVNDIPSTGELVSIVVVLAPSSCGRRFESPGNV